jgi:hypothetical protein
MKFKAFKLTILAVLTCVAILGGAALAQQGDFSVRVNRWIAVQQFSGEVTYDRAQGSRPARVGDFLENQGDGITTSWRASATLQIDTGIGQINVQQQTQLRVREMLTTGSGARITRLQVPRGQARLKLRRFGNPGSRLEIETPAGISGVRGTEFAMDVQDTGKTSVVVVEGQVATAAQGVEVLVPAGFQNFTIPGEAPTQPVALRDDPSLKVQIDRILEGGVRRLRLVGLVDPVNRVTVDGKPQEVDRQGRFESVLYYAPSFLRVTVVVTTPLGKTQTYEVALP